MALTKRPVAYIPPRYFENPKVKRSNVDPTGSAMESTNFVKPKYCDGDYVKAALLVDKLGRESFIPAWNRAAGQGGPNWTIPSTIYG